MIFSTVHHFTFISKGTPGLKNLVVLLKLIFTGDLVKQMVLSTTSSCFPVASSITLASTNKRFPSGNHSFFGCFRRRSVLTMTLATPSFNYTDKNAQHGYGWRSTDNRIGHRIGPIFSNIDKTSDRQNMTIVIDVIFQNVVITRAFRGIQKVNTYWHVEKSPNLER